MLKSLKSLRDAVGRPPHNYRPTMQVFNDLDVDRLQRDMELVAAGTERGKQEQPLSTVEDVDAFEAQIVEQVGAAQKLAYDEMQAQLATFTERLTDLDFESRFGAVAEVAHGGLADLKAEQQMALDDLHGLRRDLNEAEIDYAAFRKKHRLTRPSDKRSGLGTFIKILIILVLVIFEVVANGYFLSGGNELGLIGGIVEATLFSVLNVGMAIFFAVVLLPNYFHRNILRKFIGAVFFALFLSWAGGLNLGLAHYREVAGPRTPTAEFTTQAKDAVLQRLQTRPFELDQFESWLLFAIGILFAMVALIDGLALIDRYPGFRKVYETVHKARQDYANQRRAKIEDLADVRQDYQDAVSNLRKDIAMRRTEHSAILAHRLRLLNVFREHQGQLEKAANQLLRIYRDANLKARTTPPPPHFNKAFRLEVISVSIDGINEITAEALQEKIDIAQAELKDVMTAVTNEFERGLARYAELDKLTPDGTNGTA